MQDSYKRNYALHWAVLLFAAGAVIGPRYAGRQIVRPFRVPSAATPAPEARVHWFFILHMPEITTQYESGVDTMKDRMGAWIMALKGRGFHPLPLSEAMALVESGRGVPPKTIVTIFKPGYRHTYEVVAPIFARLQWPAVWLTDEMAMRHSDRRFITFHAARRMEASGLWDVAFSKPNGQVRLENRGAVRVLGDGKGPVWTPTNGAFALNTQDSASRRLGALTVNAAWLAPELVNRLEAEMPPLGERTFLGKGTIQGREWGVTLGDSGAGAPSFDMKAPLNRRGSRLFFLGTRGINDFRLHVQSARLVGEFWVQLRVDEAAGSGINVIYTDHAVFVVQQVQNAKTRFFFGPHALPPPGDGFIEDLTLHGQDLDVSFNNGRAVHIGGLQPTVPGQGVLQVYIADKLHGVARADGVQIQFSALQPA